MSKVIKSNSSFKQRFLFLINKNDLIVLFTYCLLSLIFFSNYFYSISPDGISYINIAQIYLTGNLADAINGYWGPLFSWILTPFILVNPTNLNALCMARILTLIIGFFTLIGLNRLFWIFNIDLTIKRVMLFAFIPFILFFSLNYVTPDLLVMCILIYYLGIIFNPNYSDKLLYGALCGFLGSLAYLSKSYALLFFFVHFVLFNLFYFFKSSDNLKRKNIVKNLFLGLIIFFIITGFWIGLISAKYGELTISTSKEYNQALVGPASQGHPMYYLGLMKPPYNSTLSAWEDPSYFKLEKWSPFQSWKDFKYQLIIIWNNILSVIAMLNVIPFVSIIIIVLSILFLLMPFKTKLKVNIFYLLVTMLIYTGGYCIILVESRYLELIYSLLAFTGAYLIDSSFKLKVINNKVKNVLLIVLALSFILTPGTALIQDNNPGKNNYDMSKSLEIYGIHGNIASNTNWVQSLNIDYYLNTKYYGLTKNNNSTNLQKELNDNNIDYYFVWGSKWNLQLTEYQEITHNKLKDLHIYSKIT